MTTETSSERVERLTRRAYEQTFAGPWESLSEEEREKHRQVMRFVLMGEGEIEF